MVLYDAKLMLEVAKITISKRLELHNCDFLFSTGIQRLKIPFSKKLVLKEGNGGGTKHQT